MVKELQWSAVWRGAVSTALFAVPAPLLFDWMAGDGTPGYRDGAGAQARFAINLAVMLLFPVNESVASRL